MVHSHIVPSGSYITETKKSYRLEAYLGTCVGVSIVDRKHQVGGLFHILLPEPPSSDTSFQPEVYASTGLLIFLRELIKKGAHRNRLEATVAGGSIVAPAMDDDFYMNIGGRTLAIVDDFLRDENIPVVYSETGGFFSCKIILNLENMDTIVEPIGIESSKKMDFAKPLNLNKEAILETIANLYPIPQTALEIIHMIRTGDYNMSLVAEKISKDQVLVAKILGFCNSPYISSPVHINSIDRAIVFLGEMRLLQVILASYCQKIFECKVGGYSMCRGGLFRHSVITAYIAETIAGFLHLNEAEAYTLGLLHDIGKVVLDQHIHAVAPFFYRQALLEGRNILELEKELIGIDHLEAGSMLALYWKFPDELKEIIEKHDNVSLIGDLNPLMKAIALANILSAKFSVGNTISNAGMLKDLKPFLQLPALTIENFYRLLELVVKLQKTL